MRLRSDADISGINETLVDGDPLPLELRDVEGFWAATLDGLRISGRPVELSTDVAILDSGDSYITLHPDDYAALMAALGAERLGHGWDRTGFAGMHYVPCSEDEFNPDWRLRIAADGSVAPWHVLGLAGEYLPTQLSMFLALLMIGVLGALLLAILHALPRPRYRKHPDGYKYTLLQRVPAMGW